MNDVHYSSKTDEWATPQKLFDELNVIFNFTTDLCANSSNAKCDHFYSPEINGLDQEWTGSCWGNFPYGREIGKWIKKAYESSLSGATIVCLIPARTDTKWWHDYVMKGEISYIKGRIKFGNGKIDAPFPSAIVVFRPKLKSNISLPISYTYKSNI